MLNLRQSGHPGGSRSKVHAMVVTLLSGAMRWDIRDNGPNVKIIAAISWELYRRQDKKYRELIIAPNQWKRYNGDYK